MVRVLRTLSVGSSVVLALSCIVSEPPGYIPPEFERPSLLLFDAKPPITQVLVVTTGLTVSIRVPIEFVPATEPIRWQLWKNFDLEGESFLRTKQLKDDATEIAIDWEVRESFGTGCQQITLLVAHDSSLGTETGDDVAPEILDRNDVAIATWWLNVNPVGSGQTLENCPPSPIPEGTGGTGGTATTGGSG